MMVQLAMTWDERRLAISALAVASDENESRALRFRRYSRSSTTGLSEAYAIECMERSYELERLVSRLEDAPFRFPVPVSTTIPAAAEVE